MLIRITPGATGHLSPWTVSGMVRRLFPQLINGDVGGAFHQGQFAVVHAEDRMAPRIATSIARLRIMANSSNNNGQTPGIDPALISAQRLQPYVARCKGDVTVALDLYLRDRSLSSSLFHDLAIIEVALRNSIDKALVSKYGPGWHRLSASIFNQRTFNAISRGWSGLDEIHRSHHNNLDATRGRLLGI